MRTTRWALAVTVIAAAMVAPAVPGSAAATSATPTIIIHGGSHGLTVSRKEVAAGTVRFRVDTTNRRSGSIVLLFRPLGHATTATLLHDFGEEGSDVRKVAARGTRDLTHDFTFYGLASVQAGTPAVVSEVLRPGTYYLIDGGSAVPKFTPLRVRASKGERQVEAVPVPQGAATVSMTPSDRFTAPRVLPAHGSVTVRNLGDFIHQMEMVRVKAGTTDAQVQAYLESAAFAHGKPAWFDRPGPTVGLPLLSPGRQLQIAYALPTGTYVLVCRIADDKTGIGHLVMGMHKVVVLR